MSTFIVNFLIFVYYSFKNKPPLGLSGHELRLMQTVAFLMCEKFQGYFNLDARWKSRSLTMA